MKYDQTSHGIKISATPRYLAEQSCPQEGSYVWLYHIRIENQSDRQVQLKRRYWSITDSNGVVRTVSGVGVVGKQPFISPGESFEYTSAAPLQTHSGIMVGFYEMVDEEGQTFQVEIPIFSLDAPGQFAN